MSKFKFSPGPWVIRKSATELIIEGADKTIIAVVKTQIAGFKNPEALPNASAIVALPELVEVVLEFLDISPCPTGKEKLERDRLTRIKAQVVLAKVRGEEG